ncbi:MAG TPA: glycoside hydrolase family 15 protein [Gammaproteobacteria bacterium]|nr:glycoside hydrolase family 15 protein [Gammaproteobacteria bacterium]
MNSLELGLIGNCGFCALIDERAEVAWCCLPRFDGDPVFCSLLAPKIHPDRGGFGIELGAGLASAAQHYEHNTAILVTRLRDRQGAEIEVTDFAPRFKHYGRIYRPTTLIRRLRPVAGRPSVSVRLRPLGDYGRQVPDTTAGSNHIRYLLPGQVMRLTTDASLSAIADETPFLLDRELVLLLGPDESLQEDVTGFARHCQEETAAYWREWARYLALPFEWQEAVIRAAITLKLCEYEDSGAILAAVTTSIPEMAGAERNWDYRYCWLRDSYFAVNALNRLGATATMEQFIRYVENIAAHSDHYRLQPLYGLSGQAQLEEHSLTSFSGFRGSVPIRVGNAAWKQHQHDVYGAVVLAAAQRFFDARLSQCGDETLFRQLETHGATAVNLFDKPDAGLWERRDAQTVSTYSSVMCWAACDRLARIAKRLALDERAHKWRTDAERLRSVILGRAWNEKQQSFSSVLDGEALDASLLLLAELGLLPASDPHFVKTVERVGRELRHDEYVFRYADTDDFGKPHNAFTLCSFWYCNALAALGRRDEARGIFEKMLGHRTRLGLLSEHIDPSTGELWGNFPQTYSMVGIIQSALRLSASWEEAF